jgi:exosome complex component CSL4
MDEKVMIGDYLGTIEEFMPGTGTFAEDGKIYAAKIGFKRVDPENHTAEVHGKELAGIKLDQIVFGEVMNVKNSNVTLVVSKIQGNPGLIDERTCIYVSNIADTYVKNPEEMFAIGDIVKAKVIKMGDGLIDVSTKGDLGVVKAFCKKCREPMALSQKKEGMLECKCCKSLEKRKIAKDYGRVSDF